MRRISARYARPGMVLHRPVYDNAGILLFEPNTVLDTSRLEKLRLYTVGEIIVDDPRVADVPVQPLIGPELEAEAVRSLRDIVLESGETGEVHELLMRQLEKPIYAMARELFPDVIGEPNLSGAQTVEDYRFVRPIKVASMAMLLGRKSGYDMLKLSALGMAAALMDIRAKLSDEAAFALFEPMASPPAAHVAGHPVWGLAAVAAGGRASAEVQTAIAQHHERWDGSGYPKGLVGEAIFEPARIIAVADTYFDLVSVHPRRPAAMPHEAVEYVMGSSGELLAPALVEVFVREVPLYPTGVTVRLNTGELGIVSNGNLGFVGRPTVRICMDADSRPIKEPYDFDLSDPEHQGTLVVQVVDY
ncbi:MAG: HD domain-containing protein [Chloroflexi bacterium]|nr:HD domain-containing protein [Chloroflexota bacterium]